MNLLNFWGTLLVGGFVLFLIISGAVKMAVKEALHEFKEEIVEEFNLRKADEVDNRNES